MTALPYLCLAGPTASGKTAAALAVAGALAPARGVEIVSVDSALVYRGLDIGTAKPTAAERAQVPHHLIDLIDPGERYSAARFVADATRAIEAIHARGHVPLLVGGTMLYFKALFDGIDAMPAADARVRQGIADEAALRGWPALHAELAAVDPVTAARLAPGDAQRIQRALEVHRISGQPLSAYHRRTDSAPAESTPPPGSLLIALEPRERSWLHARIHARLDQMLAAGFLDEVAGLRKRADLHPELPSMRCVGYRQAWEALDAGEAAPLLERAAAATRQLAKRQLTWLRSMPSRHVVACDAEDASARVVAAATAALPAFDAARAVARRLH